MIYDTPQLYPDVKAVQCQGKNIVYYKPRQTGKPLCGLPHRRRRPFLLEQSRKGKPAGVYASKTPDWIGAPVGTQRSGSDGERTSSEMSELSPQGGSKGYGTCEDDWNPLFVEALQKQDYVDYLLDTLLSPDMEERAALIASYGTEVRTIERRMAELEAGAAAGCDGRHTRSAAAPEH